MCCFLFLVREKFVDFYYREERKRASGCFLTCKKCTWERFTAYQLRLMCSRLKISGYRNQPKKVMEDLLIAAFRNKEIYDKLVLDHDLDIDAAAGDLSTSSTRKQAQCPYRLLNILFSDEFSEFSEDFDALGNKATRDQLDRGTTAFRQHFWSRVPLAFVDATNEEADGLKFKDNVHFASCTFDPYIIVSHSWQKLSGLDNPNLSEEYRADIEQDLKRFMKKKGELIQILDY